MHQPRFPYATTSCSSVSDSKADRLQASLMQTRRVPGKMQNEHIASLGTVDADVGVRGRLRFWAELPERLARLGNRVGPDDQPKIYSALHARIPMVTADEQRAVQEENAKDDERFWGAIRDLNASGRGRRVADRGQDGTA